MLFMFIIGYIPNSVVRQFFEPEPEPQPIANEKDSSFPWRLKPVRFSNLKKNPCINVGLKL